MRSAYAHQLPTDSTVNSRLSVWVDVLRFRSIKCFVHFLSTSSVRAVRAVRCVSKASLCTVKWLRVSRAVVIKRQSKSRGNWIDFECSDSRSHGCGVIQFLPHHSHQSQLLSHVFGIIENKAVAQLDRFSCTSLAEHDKSFSARSHCWDSLQTDSSRRLPTHVKRAYIIISYVHTYDLWDYCRARAKRPNRVGMRVIRTSLNETWESILHNRNSSCLISTCAARYTHSARWVFAWCRLFLAFVSERKILIRKVKTISERKSNY